MSHSLQFTPGGIVAVSSQIAGEGNETIIPANPDMFRAPVAVREPVAVQPQAQPAKRISFDKPINVLKAAKARLRDVNRELKRLGKLEVERDELKRLIHAAENKPCAIVRDIAAKRG